MVGRILTLAIAGAALVTTAMPAAAVTLTRLGTVSGDHPLERRLMVPWGASIAAETDGRLVLRRLALRPGQVPFLVARQGLVDLAMGSLADAPDGFPLTLMVEMPGMAQGARHATRRLWRLRERFLMDELGGVRLLALWASEALVLMTRKEPIRRLRDFRRRRIAVRTPGQSALIAALGARPVRVDRSAMAGALEDDKVFAVLILPSLAGESGVSGVARYVITGLPFGREPWVVAMSKRAWSRLAPERRALIKAASGRRWSLIAATIAEAAGLQALAGLRKSVRHQVVRLAPIEIDKARRLMLRARARLIAQREAAGLPAADLLDAMIGRKQRRADSR
jgi:TRAP-type transport system periplasmic protein